jgi:hypothetical protein
LRKRLSWCYNILEGSKYWEVKEPTVMKEQKVNDEIKRRVAFNYFGMDELPEGISEKEVKKLAKNLDKFPNELSDKDLEEEFEIMARYEEPSTKPSEEINVYWLHAEREEGDYPEQTSRSGKWLIFVNVENVDEAWEKVKNATEQGKLGFASKVATAKPNPNAIDPSKRVICVYTYDWKDEKDVRRVREELRRLGITNRIPYKADADTLSGKYRAKGDQRISKYYE